MRPARAASAGAIAAAALALASLVAACAHASTPASTTAAGKHTATAHPARPAHSSGSAPAAPAASPSLASPAPVASPTQAAPTPTPAVAPAPAACSTSVLQGSIGRGNGAAGSAYYPLRFTNTSTTACTLYGYPGVSFVTGIAGSQIGRPADLNPAYPRSLVVIAPGATAHAALQVANAGNFPARLCHEVAAHWLRIYPPGQFSPLYLSFDAQTCSSSARTMFVQTVQPGSGGS